MFGFYYTPLVILQAFCLYHAYRNNASQRWYWLIAFIPGIGAALYIIDTFYNRKNITTITEGVRGVINSNYKVEQLEKALRFSDTLTNKMQLAQAYVAYERFDKAIALYKQCLEGYMSEDPNLRMKLMAAYYLSGDFTSAVRYGDLVKNEKAFRSSQERVYYAWALYKIGKTEAAEVVFEELNRSFTNFQARLEYCKFLQLTNQQDKMKTLITELKDELEHMKGPERKFHRSVINEIKEFYSTHAKA